MGIQKFHQWIDRRFDASAPVKAPIVTDHLLIDLNSLVHAAARRASTRQEAVKRVMQKLDALFDPRRLGVTVQPRRSVALFSDGPAPLAKLVTQRSRRLKGKRAARADGVDENEEVSAMFDPLNISPGTEFQAELSAALTRWAQQRVAKNAGRGIRLEVVLSDAFVAGEGELKCMEYYDSLKVKGEEAIIFGGDADLVAMALCRVGAKEAKLSILDDNGRGLIDVNKLAASLMASKSASPKKKQGPSDKRKAKENTASVVAAVEEGEGDVVGRTRDLALNFAVMAIMSGGNDYLPPLGVTFDQLWEMYEPRLQLWDSKTSRLNRQALSGLLALRKMSGLSMESTGSLEARKLRLVADYVLTTPRLSGAPAAPNAVASCEPRKADLLTVRAFPPKHYGAITSGAETLNYTLRWRKKGAKEWTIARSFVDGSPLSASELEPLRAGMAIRVGAGLGDVELELSALNKVGRGRRRKVLMRRDKDFCCQLCPRQHNCADPSCSMAHHPSELPDAVQPPSSVDVDIGEEEEEPVVTSIAAWDAGEWVEMLEWVVAMYVRGRCDDYRCSYTALAAPPIDQLVEFCDSSEKPQPRVEVTNQPPLTPLACLVALIPSRSARHLLPASVRTIMDDGSPVAEAWWGASPTIPLERVVPELERLRKPEPHSSPTRVYWDQKSNTVKLQWCKVQLPSMAVDYNKDDDTKSAAPSRLAASAAPYVPEVDAPPRKQQSRKKKPSAVVDPAAVPDVRPPAAPKQARKKTDPTAAAAAAPSRKATPPTAKDPAAPRKDPTAAAAAADPAPKKKATRMTPAKTAALQCRFEFSPGGCQRGEDCRYLHTNGAAAKVTD